MVLQRDARVPVWGRAAAGEEVTVTFRGQRVSARADGTGRWRAELAPMSAAADPAELTIAAANTVVLRDVLVGEVWLCAGQSNMDWPVRHQGMSVKDAANEVAAAQFPLIRLLKIPRRNTPQPQETLPATSWTVCSPETVGAFSAVGYFYGRALHQKLGVPVGLINTSYGGTPVEAWMSRETMESNPACAASLARMNETIANWPQILAQYREASETWKREAEEAKQRGEKYEKRAPRQPVGANHPYAPVTVYNAMLHPLIPYAIRGAIWYQGEGNSRRAEEYHGLFTALIGQWRREWSQGDFPFYFVQLANFRAENPEARDWAWLREAQAKTLAVPNTGMAVAIDIGDPGALHPTNKQDVGARLARIALARTYGAKGAEDSGPVFLRCEPAGGALRVVFDHAAGLRANGALTGFEIAGEDRKFYPASAVIEETGVTVSAAGVPKPAAVRYAWEDAPQASLFNGAGLPAAPFRTDAWPR